MRSRLATAVMALCISSPALAADNVGEFIEKGGGTWMTVRNRGEPTGFAGLAAPILATAVRRATTKDLAQLKAILEGVNLS